VVKPNFVNRAAPLGCLAAQPRSYCVGFIAAVAHVLRQQLSSSSIQQAIPTIINLFYEQTCFQSSFLNKISEQAASRLVSVSKYLLLELAKKTIITYKSSIMGDQDTAVGLQSLVG
jgi:hypothetical protein